MPRIVLSSRPMPGEADTEQFAAEGRVFGRYLVGQVPSPELVARYAEASRLLFTGPVTTAETAVVGFARRHPWSVPFLDAAAGVLAPGGLLRSKLLVLAAILETTPTLSEAFLPRDVGPGRLTVRLAVSGTAAVLWAILGVPLHAVAARTRP